MRLIFYIISLGLFFSACKKKEDRTCWKVAGNPVKVNRAVEDWDRLFLGPHLDYILIQDSANYIEIEGAENLVNLVETSFENGVLSITNQNKCNFLRSYKTKLIRIKIHCKNIINIEYQGSETLTNEGVLNVPYFTLLIKDGAGPVNLNVNSQYFYGSVTHGYGDLTLSGTINYLNLNMASNGFCDTRQTDILDSLDVISFTPVDCRINMNNVPTHVEIRGSGNIYQFGYPSFLEFNQYGSGSIIDSN